MASRDEITLPATRPKSRKSLAHVPSAQTMDQENITTDFGALTTGKKAASRKSRSKSIGPGGLDALKDATGNRRKSLAADPQPTPKSILKMTMPPLREIPAHKSIRQQSPKKKSPPSTTKTVDLINFSLDPAPGATVTGTDSLINPFEIGSSPAVSETRVSLRTEEEQQAAAREREEKEREQMQKEVVSRRDARRKSLANRRVSFAPEATLHTWDVVVEYQDSTTSSNATTRRASSVSGGSVGSPHPQSAPPSSDPSEPPSTPPEQVEENTIKASPAHQRDLHQKKHRRSSGIPPMNFNNPEDDQGFSSSPFSGSSGSDADAVDDDAGCNTNSDSGDDDDTMMSVDGGDATNMSIASINSSGTTNSSGRLDEALREASRQAGTQSVGFEERDEMTKDEKEVVASFAPWARQDLAQNNDPQQDQENINPFSPAFKAGVQDPEEESEGEERTMEMTLAVGGIIPIDEVDEEADEDELSMDVTKAFGGIISNGAPVPAASKLNRRQSNHRGSSAEESPMQDETMEFTMAIGGIKPQDHRGLEESEEMTMEFTTAVGGVLPQSKPPNRVGKRMSIGPPPKKSIVNGRESSESMGGDETLDMTMVMGRIMPSPESDSNNRDKTIGMDITMALGGISYPELPQLPPQTSSGSRSQAKKIMEMETDFGSSPFRADVPPDTPPKLLPPAHTMASDTGSPSLTGFQGKGPRRSVESRKSTTPKKTPKLRLSSTPVKKPKTPSKQLTPQPPRPTTPAKTPPSKNVAMRTSSPKLLFKQEIKAATSTPQSSASKKTPFKTPSRTPNSLFQKDKGIGATTPNFVLTPRSRRSSGLGLDKTGLGSPRVAAILDRRGSIGELAKAFIPNQVSRGVRFDDPRVIEEQLDREREQEEARENGRAIMEREADLGQEEKEATLNLKEMIQSLTPKKNPLRGRKSLHIGAAKGILGKRPAELDEDDEADDEDNGGVKRLKNHQGSPVKSVKLQAPPSKTETTTGRLTRAARKSMEEAASSTITPTLHSLEKAKATTPRNQGRFKDADPEGTSKEIGPPTEREPIDEPEFSDESLGDDRIQLQDFLNMTSIRFMELTTTKRRHTIAPRASTRGLLGELKPISLEDCVAAGASTIPMLELFQHACHELKRYISEGRKTVREIETETFEENPPLFREYISATPDMKILMDNQLKNVKTHARLLSKGMWYDWRMTLLATLKEGLFKTAEGMIEDEGALDQQQSLLDTVLPPLSEKAEKLQRERVELESAAEEIANCDQEELSEARQSLITTDADIAAKTSIIADMRRQLHGKEAEIEAGNSLKQMWLEDIREAEKVREECRGWTSGEISVLKGKVDVIERERGWTITGVSGYTTSMTYRKEIELVFDASAFLSKNSQPSANKPVNSRIDLWYIGASRELNPLPLTTEKDFFLQSIRDHIRGLSQGETQIKDLLSAVSVSWNKASQVVDDIHLLNVSCPTDITKTSDNSMSVKSTLLIGPLTTKVTITLHLTSQSGENGIHVEVLPSACVVYGERFNEPKMKEFLLNRCGHVVEEKGQAAKASWSSAVAELGEKLLARGRK